MKLRSTDWWDIVLAAIVFAVVGMCYGCLTSIADAGTVCRVQKVVAHGYAAPLVAPVYYQVGQSLQREAADTLQFRHSEEYIELQQLRGFKAGVDAVSGTLLAGSRTPSQPALLPAATGEGTEPPAAPPAEPGTEKWLAFKEKFPLVAATCAGCHGRKNPDKPDGDLFLNGDMTLEGEDGELRRFQMLKKVYNGHMPPGKPLSDEQYSAFQAEMLTEEK